MKISRTLPGMLCALGLLAALPAHAFTLQDTYTMSAEQRVWYFGGVYDAALLDARTAACARRLGFEGFMQGLSKLVTALPADAASPTRKSFDAMPAATVGQLVIESECRARGGP
jgi:hypothetical protein